MEIEAQLESIDKKIDSYNTKIDNLSSLITTLIHSFQQSKSPDIKADVLQAIEEKLKDNASFPDIDGFKSLFTQIQEDFSENQSGLKIKIIELETVINKINNAIENISINTDSTFDESIKAQLSAIEDNLAALATELSTFKNTQPQIQMGENEFSAEKIDEIKSILSNQHTINLTFQKNIETLISQINQKIQTITTLSTTQNTNAPSNDSVSSINEKFDDLNLAITSVLSAIKIIDKKYVELKDFQEIIDKLTTDVVSPIMLASEDVKSFLSQTTDNFAVINDFVQEYDKGAFLALQEQIENGFNQINQNIDKISDTVNIDVNKLLTLVDEFKTNSDLSNHTISDNMEKIETMLTEYNENLEELTKTATAEVVKDGIKTLNDEFYLELLNLFNSLSFDEEAEDLKDFIEDVLASITVKTDENSEKLNNIMLQFKSLLNKIEGIEKAQNSISDYLKPEDTDDLVYSFDDIQTDLAKMRLVLNDISKSITSSELVEEISDKIVMTSNQIEHVSKLLGNTAETDENVTDIRHKIEELNEQVYDISLRTNKLILSNEDNSLELKNNLELFKDVFEKANPEKLYNLFYELTHYFNDVNEKLHEVIQTTKASHTEAITIKNALVYVGEWLDSATSVLDELRSNSLEMLNKKSNNEELLTEIILMKKSISNEVATLSDRLQRYEDSTQRRLNSIEEKLDKLLATKASTKETTSKPLNTKLDNINKKFGEMEEVLSKLSDKLMKD